MAVSWSTTQRRRVAAALRAFPVTSPHCGRLALRVHPVAVEADPTAHILEIVPTGGERCVLQPRADVRPWFWHYTVAVSAHVVDALTGVDGMERARYFEDCWVDPTALEVNPVSADKVRL